MGLLSLRLKRTSSLLDRGECEHGCSADQGPERPAETGWSTGAAARWTSFAARRNRSI
jgi:hypothetical protein